MAFFKKPQSNSVKGQLRNLIREIAFETGRELKETGKEIIKGVTMLSLSTESVPEKNLHTKEGEHTKINPEEIAKKNDQAEIEKVKRQISGSLNQTYSRASSASEYGQEQARKYQSEHKPVYNKYWEEREEERRQQAQKPVTKVNLAATGSKRKAGDWRHGTKRKRGPSPQEQTPEHAGRGKQ